MSDTMPAGQHCQRLELGVLHLESHLLGCLSGWLSCCKGTSILHGTATVQQTCTLQRHDGMSLVFSTAYASIRHTADTG